MSITEREVDPDHFHASWPVPADFPLSSEAAARASDWFVGAGLGMFVHWDVGGGYEISWPLVGGEGGELPGPPTEKAADYYYATDSFDPDRWDPDRLADRALAAGAQYAVFTSRHHSGWATWPSRAGSLTIESSPYGKKGGDLVREFTDAFRARGIRVGLYYSLSDWWHEDYPRWRDELRPYRHDGNPIQDPRAWERFLSYLETQLRELLNDYGPLDILWFDGEWERTPEEWQVHRIESLVRGLAPEILINDRLYLCGDFRTPEQFVPAEPLVEPWESCMTMNRSWAYVPSDTDYKSVHEILRSLIEVVSRGGNLLLNVGPKPDGSLPDEQLERLDALAAWMAVNREAIIGVEPGLDAWQADGPTTRRGSRVYAPQLAIPVETIVLRGVPVNRIERVGMLGAEAPLDFAVRRSIAQGRSPDPMGEIIVRAPRERFEQLVPVIYVDFIEEGKHAGR